MGFEFLISASTCTTSCKQKSVDTEENGDFVLKTSTRKEKKATRGEIITVEMNRWIMQNAVTLEQCKTEKMIEEIQTMKDIKKNYAEAIQELCFSQLNALIRALQVMGSNYRRYIISQYYLLLTKRLLWDQFIKQLFETLEDN